MFLKEIDVLDLKGAVPQSSMIAQDAVHSSWHVQHRLLCTAVPHANHYEQHSVQ